MKSSFDTGPVMPHQRPEPGSPGSTGNGSDLRASRQHVLSRRARWMLAAMALSLISLLVFRAVLAFRERLWPAPMEHSRAPLVEVVRLQPQTFRYTVPVAGTLEPLRSVDVFPKVEGRVLRVFVKLGDSVEDGDPLALVESVEYGIQANQAKVAMELAERGSELARRSMSRLEQVKAKLGDLATSQQEYEQARMDVESAERQRDMARLQWELARKMVDNATITSPVAGVVSRINAREGGMVGSDYPAFHVDDVSSLVVRCQVGATLLSRVERGQPVQLGADGLPGLEIHGRVDSVSPTLDPWTRRAPVEIVVENPDGDITGNVFARGNIVTATDDAALLLPLGAVDRNGQEASVRVVRGGVLATVVVTVLAQSGGLLAVDGLQEDELVMLPGTEHLSDGERVDILQVQLGDVVEGQRLEAVYHVAE